VDQDEVETFRRQITLGGGVQLESLAERRVRQSYEDIVEIPHRRCLSRIGDVVASPADARCRVGPSGRPGAPVCPLTTVGRKSGQRRTVPLLYLAVTT